jgi:hypothetical protein
MQKNSFVSVIETSKVVKIELGYIQTIAVWPEPKSQRNILLFIRLAHFYCHLISKFSKIAKLIIDQLK